MTPSPPPLCFIPPRTRALPASLSPSPVWILDPQQRPLHLDPGSKALGLTSVPLLL